MNLRQIAVLAVFVLAYSLGAVVDAQTVIHVDDDVPLGGDGTSWETAYRYLQDALAEASAGDEIRVAEGTYTPDQDEAGNVTPGDRDATFQLISGVGVYGGYRGCPGGDCTGGDPNERDIELYETILSGDLAGDDVEVASPEDLLDEPTRAENSFHVVNGSSTDATAEIDGVSITCGNANGTYYPRNCGAGMYNVNGGPTVIACAFSVNSAQHGGGMRNHNAHPTVFDCMFIGNSASGRAGGMYNSLCSPTLANCTFSGNTAEGGGGMFNHYASPTVTDCTFSGNRADGSGGGMRNFDSSSPTLTNCTFSGNSADVYGGGVCNDDSSPTLSNCTFTENSALVYGGGICSFYGGDFTVADCTFSGNDADWGGGMFSYGVDPTIADCAFSGNSARLYGGGICNLYNAPTVANCTFNSNAAAIRGGGMYNSNSSLMVTDCTFAGNSSMYDGGGMYNSQSSPMVTDCRFAENWVTNDGGGMLNASDSSPAVTNCTFSGNSAGSRGGAMGNYNSDTTIANCTFSANLSDDGGGGIANWTSSLAVVNCILWDNLPDEVNNFATTPTIRYSNVQEGYAGEGNIDADPMFVDPEGPDDIPGTVDDDLRLEPTSPCIDAGDNSGVTVPTDLGGHPRVVDGDGDLEPVVDMGAYEYQPVVASVDIMPDVCPNGVNPQRPTKPLRIAIAGSDSLDVRRIDHRSLLLARTDRVGEVILLGTQQVMIDPPLIADVIGPVEPCTCPPSHPDGLADLELRLSASEVIDKLQLGSVPVDSEVRLIVAGSLVDGRRFEGVDCVLITGWEAG